MKILFFLIPAFLFSVEPTSINPPDFNHTHFPSTEEVVPRNSFFYANPGVTTMVPALFGRKHPGKVSRSTRVTARDRISFLMPDVSFGKRSLSTQHVFDRNIGLLAHSEIQMLYVQGSYLFFPVPSEKLYLGIGLTGGIAFVGRTFFPYYLNVPVTVGYQFPMKGTFHFIQLQGTPLMTATVSYGVGF